MSGRTTSELQADRLAQAGLVLFLLALVVGLLVPLFRIPRLGLSTHLLGVLQGIFLLVIGMLWPKLSFGRVASWVAFWLLLYGCFGAWSANLLAGVWGAGGALLPNAAGAAHGTGLQELAIAIGLRSSAVSLIVALVLMIWSTRRRETSASAT